MPRIPYILLCLLISANSVAQCQEKKQVWLKGIIINENDSTPVALAQIASFKKQLAYAADSVGSFTISLPSNDSIKIVALGYEPKIFSIPDSLSDTENPILFPLESTSYMIKQVDINTYSAYNNYTDRLKALHAKAQEMDLKMPPDIIMGKGSEVPAPIRPVFRRDPPVAVLFFNPLSYIHYYSGKSEKEKRKLVQLFHQEKTRQLLTPEMIQEVSGFKGEKLQDFIVYCNVNIQLTDKDTYHTVKGKLMHLCVGYINQNKK